MLLILPPSETKRDGGDEARTLDLASLGFPSLARPRRTALAALRRLARNRSTMSSALGLGPQLASEVERNRSLGSSPTMPALSRYTGVLFDAFDVASLNEAARALASTTVVLHSALFGLLRADDRIPAYRLSHNSKLPEVNLKPLWSGPVARELDAIEGLVVDMRSEAYAALGPLPPGPDRVFLRVVTDAGDGTRRALNHFNKRGKGEFARAVLESGIQYPDVESLLSWAASTGIRLESGRAGELMLVVNEVVAGR